MCGTVESMNMGMGVERRERVEADVGSILLIRATWTVRSRASRSLKVQERVLGMNLEVS